MPKVKSMPKPIEYSFGIWDKREGGRVRLCVNMNKAYVDVHRMGEHNTSAAQVVGEIDGNNTHRCYLLLHGALSAHHGTYGELWVNGLLMGAAYAGS